MTIDTNELLVLNAMAQTVGINELNEEDIALKKAAMAEEIEYMQKHQVVEGVWRNQTNCETDI